MKNLSERVDVVLNYLVIATFLAVLIFALLVFAGAVEPEQVTIFLVIFAACVGVVALWVLAGRKQ